jgi:hypothetical protein
LFRLNFSIILLFALLATGHSIQQFTYQSGSIDLSEWLQMLTLCLAPLIMHIVGGAPETVILFERKPSLISRLPNFNPTSILWRYYAIADRRSRAKRWDEYDMACSNAAIWDGDKWVSSELLMVRCHDENIILKIPESKHVELMSGSFLTSVAITIQGVQGLDYVAKGAPGNALPSIFYPLAIMGLLRLQAAFWLSSEYAFGPNTRSVLEDLRERADMEKAEIRERLITSFSWKGVLFRVWWLASMLGLAVVSARLCADGLTFDTSDNDLSVSALFQRLFYTLFTVGTLLFHGFYVLSGCSNSTLIPCINSSWYKAYSVLLNLTALVCVIIAAMETRVVLGQEENGWAGYTTYVQGN